MSDHNHYSFAAKPGMYKDHYYQSQMEIRMAKLLDKANIGYKPHQMYRVFNRQGEEKIYVVDFVLDKPHKFVGTGKMVRFIEIKGPGCHGDMKKMEWLEFKEDAKGFVVWDSLLKMWEHDGLFYEDQDVWR